MSMKSRWNYICRAKPKNSDKDLSQCYFVTTNPTWTDSSTNPCLRGEKPATKRLSYGTVIRCTYVRVHGLPTYKMSYTTVVPEQTIMKLEAKIGFSRPLLFYSAQKITITKLTYFRRFITKHIVSLFRVVFWVILPCKMFVDRRFRSAYCIL
jgi:hypothetical protein